MYLLDTDVVSEMRKGAKANKGVLEFVGRTAEHARALFVSVVTVGEIRRGVDLLRHRKDLRQADRLDSWLQMLLREYGDHVLEFGLEEAQVWGHLRVPNPENAIDKQIAATALTHGLALVTRNIAHFEDFGIELINPFS